MMRAVIGDRMPNSRFTPCYIMVLAVGCHRDDPGTTGAAATQGAAEPSTVAPVSSIAAAASATAAPAALVPVVLVPTVFDTKEPSALHAAAPIEGCALDRVGDATATDTTEVSRTGEVHLIGWAADVANKVAPVVVIELAGAKKYFAPAVHATPRPDVAAFFNIASLRGAGWDVLAQFVNVAPGTYDVRVFEVSVAGDALVCDPKRKLSVK